MDGQLLERGQGARFGSASTPSNDRLLRLNKKDNGGTVRTLPGSPNAPVALRMLFVGRRATLVASLVLSTQKSSVSSGFSSPAHLVRSSRIMTSRNKHSMAEEATTVASAAATELPFSNRVMKTLDPCVVLMKEMIAEYASLWETRDGVFSLAQGVVYWEPPGQVTDAIQQAMSNPSESQLHTYCPDEGLPELRQALLEKLDQENNLSNHDVMITSGANQAFVNCVVTLLSQGDKCVVFKPYYFNHVMAVQMTQGNGGLVVGSCSDKGIPNIDWLDTTLENDSSIRMVTVVNPGNPTGVSLARTVLERIVDICGKHGVWLILDCTYEHFDHNRANMLNESDASLQFPGFEQEHVIQIFSFSKGYALAGFRCGYIVISRNQSDIFQQMLKVQDTIPICPARISQVAAMGAMQAGRSWVVNQVSTLDAGREAILNALSPLETIMGGSGAMYIMGKLPDGMDDKEAARTLVRDYGVAVIPGTFCGFPGWIRVCYSNLSPEKCEVAAQRLADGIEELCNNGEVNPR